MQYFLIVLIWVYHKAEVQQVRSYCILVEEASTKQNQIEDAISKQ